MNAPSGNRQFSELITTELRQIEVVGKTFHMSYLRINIRLKYIARWV